MMSQQLVTHSQILMLYLLRFLLICLPQSGYIHPDEFFQSVEVAAGEVFHVQHLRSWEFQSSNDTAEVSSIGPIRSPGAFYLTVTFPLQLLNFLTRCWSSEALPSPATLLVCLRLWTALISLSVDLLVFRLGHYLTPPSQPKDKDHGAAVSIFLLASSQMALVHSTRTLSNTWEMAILALTASQLMFHPHRCLQPTWTFLLGVLQAWGLFCRPTYLIFLAPLSILQLLSLLQCWPQLLLQSGSPKRLTCRAVLSCLSFLLGGALGSLALVLYDTQFFHPGSITREALSSPWSVPWVMAPWNFIKYNSDSQHLASHGAHPRVTHLMVNVPLLFTPIALVALSAGIWRPGANRAFVRSLVILSVIPLLLLSLFCHQEARFLLPLTPWLVLLCAWLLLYWPPHVSKRLLNVWCVFQLVASLLWGCLHQGGLVPMLNHLSSSSTAGEQCHVHIFYHTYMPPRSLLMMPNGSSQFCGQLVDLAGAEESRLEQQLKLLHTEQRLLQVPEVLVNVVFPQPAEPASFSFSELGEILSVHRVFGHLSMENLPRWWLVGDFNGDTVASWLARWKKELSLACVSIRMTSSG